MNHRFLRSVVAAAVSLLMLPFVGCSGSSEPTIQQALDRAQAANSSDEIASYQFTLSYVVSAEGMEDMSPLSLSGGSFLAPDRWRLTNTFGTDTIETITIGRKTYERRQDESEWRVREFPEEGQPLDWELAGFLEGFMDAPAEDVIELPSESINGIECLRFRLNHNRTLDDALEQLEETTDLETRGFLREWVERIHREELAEWAEVWIGKDDYLVRQSSNVQERTYDGEYEAGFPNVVIPDGTRFAFTATFTFSDFNQPVEIEAPVSIEP